jgi:hypothetical protein
MRRGSALDAEPGEGGGFVVRASIPAGAPTA